MKKYLFWALLISFSLFPKISLPGHQSIFGIECTPCHMSNLILQHGGFSGPACATCHDSPQVNVKDTVAKGKLGQATYCLDCHGPVDHSLAHDQTFLPSVDCAMCHLANVATEHENRGLTCTVCHDSTDPQVQSAISLGRAGNPIDCYFCHWQANHAAAHEKTGQLAMPLPDCGVCHVDNVATEHLNRNLSCDTCHESTDPVVQAAINKGKGDTLATCDDCHQWADYYTTHHNQAGTVCTDCHDVRSSPPYRKWPP